MKWQIEGERRDTGKPASLLIEAFSEQRAVAVANARDVLVSSAKAVKTSATPDVFDDGGRGFVPRDGVSLHRVGEIRSQIGSVFFFVAVLWALGAALTWQERSHSAVIESLGILLVALGFKLWSELAKIVDRLKSPPSPPPGSPGPPRAGP